jgi:hypothetical protein
MHSRTSWRKASPLLRMTSRSSPTKDQIIALHTQVSSMEIELRDMKHTKLHARVADLEEEVFGAFRD